jgi:hypothetical protein
MRFARFLGRSAAHRHAMQTDTRSHDVVDFLMFELALPRETKGNARKADKTGANQLGCFASATT